MRLFGRSKHTLIMDAENQSRGDADAEKHEFVRAGRLPLPLRRRYVLSDGLKIVLCFAILAYGHYLPGSAFSVSVAD
jgi:hypothetical protein